MHSSSDDAKKQKEQENAELDAMAKDVELRQKEGEGASEDDARGLRNQFNFSERASQVSFHPDHTPRPHPPRTTRLTAPRPCATHRRSTTGCASAAR